MLMNSIKSQDIKKSLLFHEFNRNEMRSTLILIIVYTMFKVCARTVLLSPGQVDSAEEKSVCRT